MKKTKVVIPALGIIAFATAASITGTVAWFTASKTFTMTAGEFAVVNTKDNMEATLFSGAGTTADNNDKKITLSDVANKLTDASFNHKYTTYNIIEPDDTGTQIAAKDSALTAVTADLERGSSTKIYSAFTWDIEFRMSFSQTSSKKIGLYLDLTANGDTWAHNIVKFADAHVVTEDEAALTYYTDPACKTAVSPALAKDAVISGAKTYYTKEPTDTGKGFRIAFVPKAASELSMGVAKVWAPHQASANLHYIDDMQTGTSAAPNFSDEATYDVGDVVKYTDGKLYKCTVAVESAGAWTDDTNWAETTALADFQENFADVTSTLLNTTRTPDVAGKSYMDNTFAVGLPTGDAKTAAASLTDVQNYLGYFKANGGETASLRFTCVAYFEGTDPEIVNNASTVYETMTTSLKFNTQALAD